jgi:hypothetical protein
VYLSFKITLKSYFGLLEIIALIRRFCNQFVLLSKLYQPLTFALSQLEKDQQTRCAKNSLSLPKRNKKFGWKQHVVLSGSPLLLFSSVLHLLSPTSRCVYNC